jgi:hypothetical protein
MSAPARDGGRVGVLWTSHRASRKLASAVIEGEQDLAVTAATQIARHPPYVDRPGEAEYANLNARGVRLPGVASPIAAVAEHGEFPDVDVDAFRHVDVDVPERRENRYRRPPLIHGGVAEIEVEVTEDAGREGPLAQPEPPAPQGWKTWSPWQSDWPTAASVTSSPGVVSRTGWTPAPCAISSFASPGHTRLAVPRSARGCARLCATLREAADSPDAPSFHESFLAFASQPPPSGADYPAWKAAVAERMEAGQEISYCGQPA